MRHFIFLLLALLVLCSVVTDVSAQTATAPSGSGTVGDPYLIATLDNLYWITQNSSSWGANFRQIATIDASSTTTWDGGAGFTPIGNSTTNFTGVYDGQGNSINGLFIDRSGTNSVGIFGLISGAQITSMTVNVNITGSSSVGGIAGLIQSGSMVTTCFVFGNVTGAGNNVGGVVGGNISSTITNCINSSTVSGVSDVGGVVGNNVDLSGDPMVEFSSNSGNVSGENNTGGLVGLLQSGTIVSNCINTGDVTRTSGTQSTLGAFAGSNSSGTIRYSYSIGDVSFGTTQGFVGVSTGSPVYTANFFDQEESNQALSTGATEKSTANMKSAMTYLVAGWDHTVWNIESAVNNGYPFFDWFVSGQSLLQAVKPTGSGTVGDPYLIAALSDLFWVTQTSSSWSGNFLQTTDIDASSTSGWFGGAGFSPIGNSTTTFSGVYDGDEHTITGLFIARSTTDYVGFFGFASGAEITDLGVTNVAMTGADDVGGLAGNISSSTTVTNCYSTGTVTGLGTGIGGLVGVTIASTISKCYSTANVNGVLVTGGLVGFHFSGSTISNSYSRGNVTRTSGSNPQFGSFVGQGEAGIEYSYSTGSVNIGTNKGFNGGGTPTPAVSNFFDSQTTGQATSIGGSAVAKTTAEMKSAFTFVSAGWDETVWNIDAGFNDGYPHLDWQNTGGTALTTALLTSPSGSGTVGDPYLIATLEDLFWVTQNSSSWDKNFLQTADIDASSTTSWDGEAGFTPIGNGTTAFSGVYDGDGHTITGLFISRGSSDNVGFFGWAAGSEIKNLGLVNANITGDDQTGVLAGRHDNFASISNCYSTGTVNGHDHVGGLVGHNNDNSSIANSYSTANVIASQFNGGLVGRNLNSAVISNCFSRGNVSGISVFTTGGLIGRNDTGIIQNCYSTGTVNPGTGNGFSGTFGEGTGTDNFFDSEVSGHTGSALAAPKNTAEMKLAVTFLPVGWSTAEWYKDPGVNDGYPYLAWQNPAGTPLAIQPPSGSGTVGDPYLIADLEDLYWITQNSSSWDKNFLQTADIDASGSTTWDGGAGFTPIGNSTTSFTGVYDGDGHTITGLFISRGTEDEVAMFGRTNGAEIKNLGLVSVNVTGDSYVGALAGWNSGNTMVTNCYSTGTVDGTTVVGGLVSRNHAKIFDSYSTATVSGSSFSVGGLAGENNQSATINNSYSTGNVSGTLEVGGLVGSNGAGIVTGTITNSYSRGNVTRTSGSSIRVGAFVGHNNSGTIVNSYSTGTVSFGTAQGFVGESIGSSTLTNNFFDSDVSGQTTGNGATAKTTAEMTRGYTFLAAGWSAAEWFRDAGTNNDYPYLVWEDPAGTPLQWPQITLTSGDSQNEEINTALANPFVTTVTDENANLVPDVPVMFAIATTPATATGQLLSVTNATTDASGEASTVLTLGNKSGAYTVTATSVNLTGSPVTFNASATSGTATAIALTSGDGQCAPVNTALANPMVVTVTDAGSNPVAGAIVTFAIATTPASATGQLLSVTNAITDASGEASTVLTVGDKSGNYTVTATATGLAGSPITFTAAASAATAANLLHVSGNPQSGQINSALFEPFVVRVTDAGDNPVPGTAVNFAITSTPAGATGQSLSIVNTVTNANGEASTTLTLGSVVGSYTVTATSAGLTGSPTAFTVSATNGAPAQLLVMFGNRQIGSAGSMLPQPMTVKVMDVGGNPIAGVLVQFLIASVPTGASGQSLKDSLVFSDGNGQAVTRLTLGDVPGNYTVLALAAGAPGAFIFAKATALTSVETLAEVPGEFQLYQNYPNPFNPSTSIRFGVPEQGNVRVEIYDLLGNLVEVLTNGEYNAGTYQVLWNAKGVSSGMYLVRFEGTSRISKQQFTAIRRMTLLK